MRLLFVVFLFMTANLIAQTQPTYKLIKKIELKGNTLTTDPLGNCYVESDRKVFKYDNSGKEINVYSNNNYGELSSIDATNPYKLLIFYQKFERMIFLDNMMSANGSPINLLETKFNQTTLVCHSFDNGYWIYEPLLNELLKINTNLQVQQQSGNLSRILRLSLKPNFLIELNSRIYLNNPETGILVFDQYGTYLKSIAIKGLRSFQVKDDRIHYVQDKQLHTYFFKSLETETTNLPIKEELIDVQIQKKRIYILTTSALNIFEI